MKAQEIKQEHTRLVETIKTAEAEIKVLQANCKHENTFEGNWSCRIGQSDKANICSDCGSLINFVGR